MRIRRIDFRNFRGITESTLNLEEGGFVITGPNGSGKSSCWYSVGFCFFGRVPGLTLSDLLNWDGEEGKGAVRVWFEKQEGMYRATRTFDAKTSHLVIEQYRGEDMWEDMCRRPDGTSLSSEAGEKLSRLIGIPERVFYEVVIKLQGEFGSITETTPAGRYQFFKEFADMEVWEKYNQKNEEILKRFEAEMTALEHRMASAEQTIKDTDLKPLDPEKVQRLENDLKLNKERRDVLLEERNKAVIYTKSLDDYQLASKVVEQFRDIQTWFERWQTVKAITKPEVLFDAELLEKKATRITELQTKVDIQIPAEIDQAEKTIAALETAIREFEAKSTKIAEEIERYREHNHNIQGEIKEIQKEINLVKKGKCPECQRSFENPEKRAEHLRVKVDEMKKTLIDLGPALELQSQTKKALDDRRSRINEMNKLIRDLGKAQQEAMTEMSNLKDEIAKLERSREQTELYADKQRFFDEYPYASKGSPEEVYQKWLAAGAVKPPDEADKPTRSLQEIAQELETLERDAQSITMAIHTMRSKDKEFNYHNKRIEEARRGIEEIAPHLGIHRQLQVIYGKNGAPRKVVEKWISVVGLETNKQLARLTHGKFRVKFINKTDTGRDTISLIIFDNIKGHERKYATLSGGEKTRINVAFAMALANSYQNIMGVEIDTMLFDEVYGLDEEGFQEYANAIELVAKEKTIVGAISCFKSMSSYFSKTIQMKEGRIISSPSSSSPQAVIA